MFIEYFVILQLFLFGHFIDYTDQITNQFEYVKDWKINYKFGDVSSVSIISSYPESLAILHRGSAHWNGESFDYNNIFQGDKVHDKISDPIIIQVDPRTGSIIGKIKPNYSFYMPHSITVTDDSRYLWISDVALHQVVRFAIIGRDKHGALQLAHKPDLVFGERFVPGNDEKHLCKPTKVKQDQNGNIFIADGYCNGRVICFYKNGTFANEWRAKPKTKPMLIVHSLTIVPDKTANHNVTRNTVWVADRENQKLHSFNYNEKLSITTQNVTAELGAAIYCITYDSANGLLYGASINEDSSLFSMKISDQKYHMEKFLQLKMPHDLDLAQNGTSLFVADIINKKLHKFNII